MKKIRQGLCGENFSFLAGKMAKLAYLMLHSGQKNVAIQIFDYIINSKYQYFSDSYLLIKLMIRKVFCNSKKKRPCAILPLDGEKTIVARIVFSRLKLLRFVFKDYNHCCLLPKLCKKKQRKKVNFSQQKEYQNALCVSLCFYIISEYD